MEARIIRYKGYTIKIGSSMTINNIVVKITDDFIDANKEFFDIEYPPSGLDKYKAKLDIHKYWLALKNFEPRFYWLKIFQLIAEDLNKLDEYQEAKYFVIKENDTYKANCIDKYPIKAHITVSYNLTYFKSIKGAAKAKELMGDYIKYVV